MNGLTNVKKLFKKLKEYLLKPPILTWLEPREMLYVYLAMTKKAVTLLLIKEEGEM